MPDAASLLTNTARKMEPKAAHARAQAQGGTTICFCAKRRIYYCLLSILLGPEKAASNQQKHSCARKMREVELNDASLLIGTELGTELGFENMCWPQLAAPRKTPQILPGLPGTGGTLAVPFGTVPVPRVLFQTLLYDLRQLSNFATKNMLTSVLLVGWNH